MEKPLGPKPPIALVALSVVVIAVCLLSVSFAIVAISFDTWDPCSLFAGIIMLPLPAALAIQQYRATFRHQSRSATVSSVLLFFVAGLATFSLLMTLGEAVINNNIHIPWTSAILPVLLSMLITALVAAWSAMMNRIWSRQLKQFTSAGGRMPDRARYSLRDVMVVVGIIASVTALVTYLGRTTPPRHAEHISLHKAPFHLPVGASDISYCRGFRGTVAYEFNIDEKAFVAWVESGIGSFESRAARVAIEPIATPFSIPRYHSLASELKGPNSITITDGLYYAWSKEDRGVNAAFDRTTGRAYYFAHYH